MKDELSDFSRLEALKDHPVSSQIDDVFKAVIKEKKNMVKKELSTAPSKDLPSLPDSGDFSLSDGEFSLDLSESQSAPEPTPVSGDMEFSLSEDDHFEIGEPEQTEGDSEVPEFGDLSLDSDFSDEEISSDLSIDEGEVGDKINNLGELSFENDAGDEAHDLSLSDESAVASDLEENALSLDEIDLGVDDEVPGLDQTSEKILDEVSLELGELEAAPESLGLDEISEDIGLDEDLLAVSGSDQNDLSEDAKKKLQEIDEIMVMDASTINIPNDRAPEKNLDEPLVSEDLDLGSLNFSAEESSPETSPKEEKPKKKKKEIEAKEHAREVGEELREISGAYTVEMERLQATLSNLRSDREELLQKIQKYEEERILQSRQTLSLRAELDERKIELTIIRKKLNEEINELKDRLKLHEEKRLILEEKNRVLTQELEKAAQRIKIDVKKVQLRERELEQKLELLKADAETQIRHRDLKILELKRRIDSMEFDMESISQQEKRSVESRFELEDKLEKAIKTLRTAINVLEDEPDRIDALKALKKNIDM